MQLGPYNPQDRMDVLEPLQQMPFPPPFGKMPVTPRRGSAAAALDGNETPTSESWSLPSTPILAEPILASDSQPANDRMDAMSTTQDCPAAPFVKDMDSFSQGTGQGSFEFSMKDGSVYDDFERPPSVAYHPAEPEISIENWRRDVSAHLEGPGSGVPAYIPIPTPSAMALSFRPKRVHSSSGSDFGGDSCVDSMWRKHLEAKRRRVMQNDMLPVIEEGFSVEMSQDDGCRYED